MSTAKIDRRVEHSHHFNSMDHEHESVKQGVWIFMATEVMMFGALFVGYFIYRAKFPETYIQGGSLLDWRLGAANTLVLLASSFTMALAVKDTMEGHNKKAYWKVMFTMFCAIFFLVVKFFEYKSKIGHGLFPGFEMWDPAAHGLEALPQLQLFMTIYFIMTGLHGLHILIGVGLMLWLLKRLKNNEFSPQYYVGVEGVGLYWHIVDVIWIYLFPLMYLI